MHLRSFTKGVEIGEGTGLGLSITYSVMKDSREDIIVESVFDNNIDD